MMNLFIAKMYHSDHWSSLSSQMSWPQETPSALRLSWKKATWPSVNAFNSLHTLCVQQLLVSSSIYRAFVLPRPFLPQESHIPLIFSLQFIQIKGYNGKEGYCEVTNWTWANLARKTLSPVPLRLFHSVVQVLCLTLWGVDNTFHTASLIQQLTPHNAGLLQYVCMCICALAHTGTHTCCKTELLFLKQTCLNCVILMECPQTLQCLNLLTNKATRGSNAQKER